MKDFPFARAGVSVGDVIREVQLADCCKHTVGVFDNGYKVGRSDDGAAGTVGGGDIRGVQLSGHFKHSVDVYDDGDKSRGTDDGSAEVTVGGDIRGVQLARGCKRPAIDTWVHEHARQNKEEDRDCEQWSLTGLHRRIFCGVQVATWWDLYEVAAS